VVLLEPDDLSSATNHNGGALHFGPDGKLYIAVGENANGNNSQTLSNLLGKILRINADGTIPVDNPFYATATGRNRAIWALGLRNPFTFGFQNGTTRMFINDVGQSAVEEINDGIGGANYGWPTTEGETTDPRFTSPLFVYGHGSGATVGWGRRVLQSAGGASSYVGRYFFADY
jgi:glucose/arabinose dehydrogenase